MYGLVGRFVFVRGIKVKMRYVRILFIEMVNEIGWLLKKYVLKWENGRNMIVIIYFKEKFVNIKLNDVVF